MNEPSRAPQSRTPQSRAPQSPGPVARLAAAGFPMDGLTGDELAVYSGLTGAEVDLLLALKERLDAAGPEVRAHGEIAGGALF